MPFILANAWLASALMELPDLCLPYMANDARLTSAANLKLLSVAPQSLHRSFKFETALETMICWCSSNSRSSQRTCRNSLRTSELEHQPAGRSGHSLSWDECQSRVLGILPFAPHEPGHAGRLGPWRIPNEPPLFPPGPGCAGPDRCDCARERRAGASAGASGFSDPEPVSHADTLPQRNPGAAARGNQIPGRYPLGGPDPHAATARAGSDRRSLWRAVHAGGKKGGGHARHRQLG